MADPRWDPPIRKISSPLDRPKFDDSGRLFFFNPIVSKKNIKPRACDILEIGGGGSGCEKWGICMVAPVNIAHMGANLCLQSHVRACACRGSKKDVSHNRHHADPLFLRMWEVFGQDP